MVGYRRLLCVSVLAGGALVSTGGVQADAGTATATMLVTATVLSFCSISAQPLAFGNYSSTVLNAASSVTVSCTLGTPYNVGLDVGVGTGATVAARKMTFGANTLSYGLFSDAAHTVAFGPTIGTNTVTGTATLSPQVISVYGQIPANQLSAPGAYTDTVTATVTY